MIEITNEAKTLFMNTSVPKQLVIPFEDNTDVSGVSFYTGNISSSGGVKTETTKAGYWYGFWSDTTEWGTDFTNFVIWNYLHYAKYLCFSFNLTIYEIITDGQFHLCALMLKKDGTTKFYTSPEEYTLSEMASSTRMKIVIPITDDIDKITHFGLYNKSDKTYEWKYGLFSYKVELGNEPEFEAKYSKCPVLDGHDIADYVTIGNPIADITNNDLSAESFSMTESLCSDNNIKFGLCESGYVRFNIKNRKERINGRTINPKLILGGTEIPLGRYTIHSTEKQSKNGLVEKEVIAYDDLTKLEQSAADWYTQYMYGIDTSDSARAGGFEYARQIYSTYFNFASTLGLESDSYEKEVVCSYDYSGMKSNLVSKFLPYSDNVKIQYTKITIENPDVSKPYQVVRKSPYDEVFMFSTPLEGYLTEVDSLGRGVLDKASILVEETRTGKNVNRFLVDSEDHFMLSPTTTSINIYIPCCTHWIPDGTPLNRICDKAVVYKIDRPINLANGHIRLLYYNWMLREIFPCDSSITGRDVVRSLLEVCGCFYKLDRNGKPRFYYCEKTALYPSEKLYPRDGLYPIKGTEQTLSRALYYGFQCEDYEVKDYGRIQIKKDIMSNEPRSSIEWEYVGDSSKDNTYIIEDNIFYCSSEMEYEYDSMIEVSEMLENMYMRISNMGYIPSEVHAVGLPYVECGDRISLLTKDGGIETFVFSRTLSGIQSLVDSIESHGDECNEAISDFGYKEWNETNG